MHVCIRYAATPGRKRDRKLTGNGQGSSRAMSSDCHGLGDFFNFPEGPPSFASHLTVIGHMEEADITETRGEAGRLQNLSSCLQCDSSPPLVDKKTCAPGISVVWGDEISVTLKR